MTPWTPVRKLTSVTRYKKSQNEWNNEFKKDYFYSHIDKTRFIKKEKQSH